MCTDLKRSATLESKDCRRPPRMLGYGQAAGLSA